jgi:hypothetical protein
MLNAKKVFRHDSATRKLISADAVQLKGDYSVIYGVKEILKSDRRFDKSLGPVSTFFAKRKLLNGVKNKINSGDWLILNEEDFSPTMSIIEKSVFEAKFYFGIVLRGYVYTSLDDERGTIKEPATALRITGEEDNIEAIEYFTSVFGSFSRANIRESKNKSKGFLHLIMYGKEVKIKHYDYMLYTSIEHKIIIIPKIQVESGGYTFFIHNRF